MAVEQLTVTDLPRGKGVDPNRAGYQIKACSAGLDDRTKQLLFKHLIITGWNNYPASLLCNDASYFTIVTPFINNWTTHCQNSVKLTRHNQPFKLFA